MFRAHALIIGRSKLHYTASCIITHIGGHLMHRLREDWVLRGSVMQFWLPDDERMCSKHVEAWNKPIVKQKFCASSWLITEINVSCIWLLYIFLFFQYVGLLDFQPKSDTFWQYVSLQGHISDIQFVDNKSLFWSPLSHHEVWAWSFMTPFIDLRVLHKLSLIISL